MTRPEKLSLLTGFIVAPILLGSMYLVYVTVIRLQSNATITAIDDMYICTKSLPPQCNGGVTVEMDGTTLQLERGTFTKLNGKSFTEGGDPLRGYEDKLPLKVKLSVKGDEILSIEAR